MSKSNNAVASDYLIRMEIINDCNSGYDSNKKKYIPVVFAKRALSVAMH